ncbi:hypothetical protein FHS29_005964 [Saccharothrix tamanrassetensis]|uniref:Uncharacterized protein n=1 Tax=Saccharothrix tamanrassetensis TaxID=1051531 RepID=A0A841CSP3_9PSEU|nr:hypothetical protein [Saccharothrix tamanrassetensis]MBB5959344.1 hypothetical protein [Saccharothrix tamanrassetensis]
MSRRVAGVVALVISAPLVLVATFLPLYEQRWEFTYGHTMTVVQTGWEVTSDSGDGDGLFGREALYGMPMVVAALLLVLGAVRAGAMWGRLVAACGAMLLLGSAWTVGHFVLATYLLEQPGGGLVITTDFGLALAVLGLASVLAVGGALMVQDWPSRVPGTEAPLVYRVEGDDDDTPPFGIPLPVEPGTGSSGAASPGHAPPDSTGSPTAEPGGKAGT